MKTKKKGGVKNEKKKKVIQLQIFPKERAFSPKANDFKRRKKALAVRLMPKL